MKAGVKNRPPTATVKAPAKPAGGWNASTVAESKFFDKEQDKDLSRKHKPAKSVKFQESQDPVVVKDGANLDVVLYGKSGKGQSV